MSTSVDTQVMNAHRHVSTLETFGLVITRAAIARLLLMDALVAPTVTNRRAACKRRRGGKWA